MLLGATLLQGPGMEMALGQKPSETSGPHLPAGGKAFAAGSGPDWSLTSTGAEIIFVVGDAKPRRFQHGRWSPTPKGRRLTATGMAGDQLVMIVTHSLCEGRYDMPGAKMRGSRVALTVDGGTVLYGCLLGTGDQPYPGA